MDFIYLDKPTIFSRTTADDLLDRQHEFIISDETPDDYGTVFKVEGWDLTQRMKGKKKVTYGHPSASDKDPDVIIGKGDERISDGKLMSVLTIEPETVGNRIANTVHEKLMFGSLTDASIRAFIYDGREGDESRGEDPKLFYFTRHVLSDWGVVPDGSNPSAMKTRDSIRSFIQARTPVSRHRDLEILRVLATRYYIM